ncbi:Oxoglutarate and iron-dependent oxygenase degradation C-term-domain-containing protein [Plectosphaerella cucumerina]|uniref:uS12 prolyl 3,4-dihydroxylase n=1 Tax=Plectosphaerella cucumerina TaxID=40658 RepID=A0A8K0TSY3_9PEZI|nr:Oxoglutarate and iron-dependent oxygenase degradation C-term-domain-containing protein [Plectosphaerella cucumerina]
MKRKAESHSSKKQSLKKRSKKALSADDAKARFRDGLFDKKVLNDYTTQYAESDPYKHAVIHQLVNDKLLRSVRDEIRDNVSFTPKETDIYKIHQSGDLANLDGLDDDALSKLPSLLSLRDAIYSETFRNYVSHITGCGPLSGRKTDMAINVYTPGCFLLCHDDVIGSRKVSYILYLVDPDIPWKPEWGGALRLFPVNEIKGKDGKVAKTPSADFTKVIPPAWNQLSFFAVQPGESFHDVEEVYHAETPEQLEKEGGRIRMAISGWFHIPQIGEDGYVKGAEEKLAENSSLMQLQGNPEQYDTPVTQLAKVEKTAAGLEALSESDLDFLVKYIAPTYLTPDALEQVTEHFEENSSITLPNILSNRFATRLREYIENEEKTPLPVNDSVTIEKTTAWRTAKPPHKHRYLYQQPSGPDQIRTSQEESPLTELLDTLLPSRQFRQWLQTATGCVIEGHDLTARRFRHGQDYTLATGHDGKPRLELNLGITPTSGWGDEDGEDDDEEDEDEDEESEEEVSGKGKGKAKSTAKGKQTEKAPSKPAKKPEADEDEEKEVEEVGGVEVYMAGDDDDDDEDADPEESQSKKDAAIYRSSGDDDNILFFQAPAWNKLTLVLRDSGALKFVKYVSRKAPGDRWDVSGNYEVEEQDLPPDEGDSALIPDGDEWDDEEEFQGFSDPASESD